MVGREKEISDLIGLLKNPETRVITLHGFGGTGKTRLAVEIGQLEVENFTDGVWFVALGPLNSADQLLTATASALRFDFGSSVDQKNQLFNYLQEKNLLLIFDNIEHLLPQAAFFLEELLQNTDQARILVTSRQPINMPWEWAYPLHGLEYRGELFHQEGRAPAAVELFLQHLKRAGITVETADVTCAAEICQMVNGLPLALILAASWGRTLACNEIVEEIHQNVAFLKSRGQISSDKHSSMQAVFDYSWHLLSDHERSVLRKLSIFQGGFDREAASAVTGADLATLAALVDQAFIERAQHNHYEIHELLRQYLHDQLLQAQEEQTTRDAHLVYYANLAKEAKSDLWGKHQYARINQLKLEIDNISSSLEWCLKQPEVARLQKGLQMLVSTERLWTLPLLTKTGSVFLFRLLAAFPQDSNEPIYVQSLNLAGRLAYLLEDLPLSRQYTSHALEIAMHLGDPRLIADTYYVQSLETFYRKDYKDGQALAQQALENYRASSYEPGIAQALYSLGRCESYSGNTMEAKQYLTSAMDLIKVQGDVRTQYSVLHALGEVVSRESQQFPQARIYLQEALEHARQFNDKFNIGHMLNLLGEIEREEGKLEQAVPYYEEAIAIEKELGRQDELILDEGNLAFVYCRLGKYERARTIFLNNLRLALKSDHLGIEITSGLLGLATIALADGKAHLAAKVLGAIDVTKEALMLWATDRSEYERTSSAVEAILNDSEFRALFQEGQTMGEIQVAELFLNPTSKEHSRREAFTNNLTRRELEILRLVAHGLTDAQIAARLVLSKRTVNAHLTSIYNKLGVNSRSAATRFAMENGLT